MGRSRLWVPVPVVWHDAPPNPEGLIETLHPIDGWAGILDRQASAPPERLVPIENSPRREEYGLPYIGIRKATDDRGEIYYEARVRADTPSGTRYHQCETRAHAEEWAEGWFHKRFARARQG